MVFLSLERPRISIAVAIFLRSDQVTTWDFISWHPPFFKRFKTWRASFACHGRLPGSPPSINNVTLSSSCFPAWSPLGPTRRPIPLITGNFNFCVTQKIQKKILRRWAIVGPVFSSQTFSKAFQTFVGLSAHITLATRTKMCHFNHFEIAYYYRCFTLLPPKPSLSTLNQPSACVRRRPNFELAFCQPVASIFFYRLFSFAS